MYFLEKVCLKHSAPGSICIMMFRSNKYNIGLKIGVGTPDMKLYVMKRRNKINFFHVKFGGWK